MASDSDFARLEQKVDKLTDAVTQLVLLEERQIQLGRRMESVENSVVLHAEAIRSLSKETQSECYRLDSKIDKWVNRGIGGWAVIASAWAIFQWATK